jgi:hypothetical protein
MATNRTSVRFVGDAFNRRGAVGVTGVMPAAIGNQRLGPHTLVERDGDENQQGDAAEGGATTNRIPLGCAVTGTGVTSCSLHWLPENYIGISERRFCSVRKKCT